MKKNILQKMILCSIAIMVVFFACNKPVVYNSALEDTATYSLGNVEDTTCSGASLTGTYTHGVLLSGDTLSLSVNVSTIGSYVINTTTEDSISFNKTGVFDSLGFQTVHLVGSGIPTTSGTFTYRVTGRDSSCLFSIAVQ